jgi:hypothetical protein
MGGGEDRRKRMTKGRKSSWEGDQWIEVQEKEGK